MGGSWNFTMIHAVVYIIVFALAFVVQTTIAPMIGVLGATPDFLLIFVVFAALRNGGLAGSFWGFVVGLSQDIYAPVEWLGAGALSMTIVGFLLGQLEEKFLNLDLVTKLIALAVGYFVNDAIYYFTIGMSRNDLGAVLLRQSLPAGLYTMLLGVFAFYLLNQLPGQRRAS